MTFDERTYVEDDFDFLHIFNGTGTLVGSYTGGQLSGITLEIPASL